MNATWIYLPIFHENLKNKFNSRYLHELFMLPVENTKADIRFPVVSIIDKTSMKDFFYFFLIHNCMLLKVFNHFIDDAFFALYFK